MMDFFCGEILTAKSAKNYARFAKILSLRETKQSHLLNRQSYLLSNYEIVPNFGNFTIFNRKIMGRNTSISLGNHFENFIENSLSEGRFKNASEVIRAGLRLLEEEENRLIILKNAVQEGIDSGRAIDFDPKRHLESLKAMRKNG